MQRWRLKTEIRGVGSEMQTMACRNSIQTLKFAICASFTSSSWICVP